MRPSFYVPRWRPAGWRLESFPAVDLDYYSSTVADRLANPTIARKDVRQRDYGSWCTGGRESSANIQQWDGHDHGRTSSVILSGARASRQRSACGVEGSLVSSR